MDEFLVALEQPPPPPVETMKTQERTKSAGGAKRRDALLASAHARQAASDPLRRRIEQWFLGPLFVSLMYSSRRLEALVHEMF